MYRIPDYSSTTAYLFILPVTRRHHRLLRVYPVGLRGVVSRGKTTQGQRSPEGGCLSLVLRGTGMRSDPFPSLRACPAISYVLDISPLPIGEGLGVGLFSLLPDIG